MKTQRLGVISAVLLSALLCGAQKRANSSQTERFPSPDGAITALVRSTKAPYATKESRIELRLQDGRVLASRNYASKDGEHGQGVTKAAWTPDSQFFVYSLESSGGHQAWHTPVQFFTRGKNTIVSLDDALNDAVTKAQFLVSAPDSVTVQLRSSGQMKTISLHDLHGTWSFAKNEPEPCTHLEAMQAEENTDHLRDWNAVYQSFTRFSQCDDGGIAEGYSDAIGKLLADNWNQFPDLVRLAAKDKRFQSFVLRHVDETIPDDTLKKLAQNAKGQCPTDAARLCKLIIRTASQ
jgi:hypothetical protein